MSGSYDTFASRLYRSALFAFPRPVRAAYGEEMVAAFVAAHAQRQRLGAASARRFILLAWLDTLRAGLGTRFGSGGVSAPPPRGVGGLVARGADRFWLAIGSDLRLAVRSLVATPSYTLAAIFVLALGVGVNGALFNALRAALLAPAPFPAPERLVVPELQEVANDAGAEPRGIPWSYPKFRMLDETPDLAAEAVAAYAVRSMTITGNGGEPSRIGVEVVTPDYLQVLGVSPMLGGGFSQGDSGRQAVISWQLWRDRYGEDAGLIGDEIVLNSESLVVVGVMPVGFRGLSGSGQAWISTDSVPVLLSPRLLDNADGHWLRAIGRLHDGATLQELAAQLQSIGARVNEAYPWSDGSHQTGTATLLDEARRNPRAQQAVAVVSGAAALVLLLACINLAVLVLARGRDRQREIAVRLALGGSRWRVSRGLIAETVLLAIAAGLVGLVIASFALQGLATAWPDSFLDGGWNIRFVDATAFTLDLSTVAFTLGLAIVAGLLFAVGPALRLTRADLGAAMRSGAGATRARATARRLLVGFEVAVALVLAVGAGLMIASLGKLVAVDDGIEAEGLVTFAYSLPRNSPHYENSAPFHDELLARLRSLPGVEAASIDCSAPRNGHCWITAVARAGDHEWEESQRPSIGVHMVDETHFDTIGAALRRGRGLEASDSAGAAPVVVINEFAARELFGEEDPIGKLLFAGTELLTEDGAGATIVGVVGDILYDSPAQGVTSELYLSHRQEQNSGVAVMLRVAGDPFAVMPAVRAELAAMDPDLPIYGISTVQALGAEKIGDTTAVMTLLAAFAGLAVLLAATGVWGVVAHAVTGRKRELGIRLALGAAPRQVVGVTLRQGASAALAGGVVGMLAAWGLSRVLSSLLYEVSPTDGSTFALAAGLLVAVTLLAAWFPARRAARLDPVQTLRAE